MIRGRQRSLHVGGASTRRASYGAGVQPERWSLFGRDHVAWNTFDVRTSASRRTAAGTSVGGDYVQLWKSHLDCPNEDCAVVAERGARTMLAVLDGHNGERASHVAAERLGSLEVPESLRQLKEAVLGELFGGDADDDISATTMVVAVLDRDRGRAFGLSFGDSSAVLVGRNGSVTALADKLDDYVRPWSRGVSDAELRTFDAAVHEGDDLLLFSDGVGECHRFHPETSVTLDELRRLHRAEGDDAERLCRALLTLALAGVHGHPGGEDNVTVAATRC